MGGNISKLCGCTSRKKKKKKRPSEDTYAEVARVESDVQIRLHINDDNIEGKQQRNDTIAISGRPSHQGLNGKQLHEIPTETRYSPTDNKDKGCNKLFGGKDEAIKDCKPNEDSAKVQKTIVSDDKKKSIGHKENQTKDTENKRQRDWNITKERIDVWKAKQQRELKEKLRECSFSVTPSVSHVDRASLKIWSRHLVNSQSEELRTSINGRTKTSTVTLAQDERGKTATIDTRDRSVRPRAARGSRTRTASDKEYMETEHADQT